MAAFAPISGGRLSDQVASAIRQTILSGELAPGERLIEADLADQMSVSRGTVREALQGLARQGLVEIHPRRGTFVYQLTKGEARDLALFRAAVEGLAAKTVAQKQPARDLRRLEKLVLALEEGGSESGKLAELRDLDVSFHNTMIEASGNKWVAHAWSSLHPFVWLLIGPVFPAPEEDRNLGPRHRRILEAILSEDPEEAERILREHILGAESKLPVIEAWPGDDDAIVAGAIAGDALRQSEGDTSSE